MRLYLLILFIPILLLADNLKAVDTLKLQNATNIYDSYINTDAPNYPMGSATTLEFYYSLAFGIYYVPVIGLNGWQDSIPANNHVTSAKLFVYTNYSECGAGCIFKIFELCKPENASMYEANITWSDWFVPDSEWQTSGAGATCQPCTYNSGDGTGCDRETNWVDSISVTIGTGAWFSFTLDTTSLNAYLRDEVPHVTYYLRMFTQNTSAIIRSVENATSSTWPYFELVYEEMPPTAAGQVIIIQQ